jgi:DNA-binding response OmpR family regulator
MANLPRAMERVVVADDNPAMTSVLAMALRMWGWEVIVAHDGLAAITAIRKTQPAVAVVDIGLPGLNGLEVARIVRATDAAPRLLIALSGYGEEQDRQRSHEAGFDSHLVKPVDPDVLRKLMMSACRRDEDGDGDDLAARVDRPSGLSP